MSAVLDEFQAVDQIGDFTPLQPPTGTVRKEATRYLFNALDVLTPERKSECRRVRDGGHEVQSFCLSRTRGFLRKGRITPLDMGGEPILEELLPDNSDSYPITNPESMVPTGTMHGSSSALVALKAFPGIELPIILGGSANHMACGEDGAQRFCLVEMTPLVGKEYRPEQIAPGLLLDRDIWDIQKYIFPDYPKVPIPLSEFRGLIKVAYDDVDDVDVKQICREMLESCELGESWANNRIDSEHKLMKQGALATGYAYTYSKLAPVLLEQLGMPRQDEELKRISDLAKSFRDGQQQIDIGALLTGLSAQNQNFAETLLKGIAAMRGQKAEESKKEEAAVKESAAKPKQKE